MYVIQFWDKLKMGWTDMEVLTGINVLSYAEEAFAYRKSILGFEKIRLVKR